VEDFGISLYAAKASENDIMVLPFGVLFPVNLTSDNDDELDLMLLKDELGEQMVTLMGAALPIDFT
jgi:hypothetical protein